MILQISSVLQPMMIHIKGGGPLAARLMAMFGFGMGACETADISLNSPLLS